MPSSVNGPVFEVGVFAAFLVAVEVESVSGDEVVDEDVEVLEGHVAFPARAAMQAIQEKL